MNLHAQPKLPASRLLLLRIALVAAVVLLVTGFWQLQVVRSDFYARLADKNYIRTLPLMAPRGSILDRHGELLVHHYASFSVILAREHVQEIRDVLPLLARGLSLDPVWLEQHLAKFADAPPFQPIVLKDEASMADIAFVEAHRLDLPELELILMYRRRYPLSQSGAHLLGYVGEASRKEIELHQVSLGAVVGKMGVEQQYNAHLLGTDGERRVIVDSRGKEVGKLSQKEPEAGRPLQLTLDAELQRAAEAAVQGRQGAVVALDPRHGDILAFVSHPTFDPNLFAVSVSADEWRALTDDPDKPLLNRVTQAQLSPGSVFKIFVATAALEGGFFDRNPNFRVTCPGWANHYGRVFRCWRPEGHGVVDLHRALVESCDVFFYQLGRQLGIDNISGYAQKLGLGRPTHIDLPGEKGGLVPSREWKQRTQKQPWWDGETISVAIGQGPLLVTPLQLAYAIGGIAAGGVFVQPHLLLDPQSDPEVRRVPLKPETVRILTDALWGVVNENGTGTAAQLPEIDLAGKTGTAQLVGSETLKRIGGRTERTLTENAWFVGFAPRRNPEIVVVVLLEHGLHGATAAPVAREVIKAYYDGKNRPPAGQVAGAPPPPAADSRQVD